MIEKGSITGRRSLGEVESDLLNAEAAFTDADTRLKNAERDRRNAERDRKMAFEAVNKHQAELDLKISELRRRSAPGSRWSSMPDQSDELTLTDEDALPPAFYPGTLRGTDLQSPPVINSVTAQFDTLRRFVASPDHHIEPDELSRTATARTKR